MKLFLFILFVVLLKSEDLCFSSLLGSCSHYLFCCVYLLLCLLLSLAAAISHSLDFLILIFMPLVFRFAVSLWLWVISSDFSSSSTFLFSAESDLLFHTSTELFLFLWLYFLALEFLFGSFLKFAFYFLLSFMLYVIFYIINHSSCIDTSIFFPPSFSESPVLYNKTVLFLS